MPRPKKEGLSEAVGKLTTGRKRGNSDFVSSSFYVPKGVNTAFNRALLTLKDADIDVDRSDILTILMDRFSTAVEEAERSEDGLDMEKLIESAGAGAAVSDTAGLNYLKEVRKKQIDLLNAATEKRESSTQASEAASREMLAANNEIIKMLIEKVDDAELVSQVQQMMDYEKEVFQQIEQAAQKSSV